MRTTKRGKDVQRIVFANGRYWEDEHRLRRYLINESRKKSRIYSNKKPNIQSKMIVKKIIAGLEVYQPIGLIYMSSISEAVERRIRIFFPSQNANFVMGKRSKETIDIEFQDTGHWTLRNGKDPKINKGSSNDCLFEAVAAQVGLKPEIIRHRTINLMKKNESKLARLIEPVSSNNNLDIILKLMLGGACYTGNSPSAAGRVIDNSQKGTCHPSGLKGHPRGHASHPNATGNDESVENYSRNGWKTGFLSRKDQDLVANLALQTNYSQQAMDRLNEGASSEAVHINIRELGEDDLPRACEYRNGSSSGSPRPFHTVTAVLRHHMGEYRNKNADVFVHTFYPRL